MLLDLLPQLGVLLNADLLLGVELVEAAEVHVLGEERDNVLVESLPVRVLEVVPALALEGIAMGEVEEIIKVDCRGLTSGCPRSRSARRW